MEPYSDILTKIRAPITPLDKRYSNGNLPPQTVYSCREAKSRPLEVPLQTSYTGPKVIPSDLADTLCCELGVTGMLAHLNRLLGTEGCPLDASIPATLECFVDSQYDFGMAYAFMRPFWFDRNQFYDIHQDTELRAAAVDKEKARIVNPHAPPRRLWDLYANRVIPFWLPASKVDTTGVVSHAWMPEEQRHSTITPINFRQWPVPIPMDTTLDLIRVELLNMGMEHAWLDVLCLRQEDTRSGSDAREALRREEWGLDVPTIGHIYQEPDAQVIPYYSGLGRPFRIENLDSKHHWLNRAWTVQETRLSEEFISSGQENKPLASDFFSHVGGLTSDFQVPRWEAMDPSTREFFDRLSRNDPVVMRRAGHAMVSIIKALAVILPRSATTGIDKIAGLAYIIRCNLMPLYINNESPEEAWMRLLELMPTSCVTELLSSFPQPGEGLSKWCPSWQQLLESKLEEADVLRTVQLGGVFYDNETKVFFFSGHRRDDCSFLESGQIEVPLSSDGDDASQQSAMCRFKAHSRIPDSEVLYTLLGGIHKWAVGQTDESGRFAKVSVIEIPDKDAAMNFMRSCYWTFDSVLA